MKKNNEISLMGYFVFVSESSFSKSNLNKLLLMINIRLLYTRGIHELLARISGLNIFIRCNLRITQRDHK